ncbi:host cell division inhibitor Icd-like protein [Bibersteinia trehalosi]|uniref:host cell division inhibitor Icd-like protein n=1 Tax=Bibersteinia trehalosi TaxID=47735 RepID=UPI004045A102
MKKFIYQKQSHFTADGDHFKANNRTLADFVKSCELSPKNNRLLLADLGGMLFTQSEKEIAERGNSNNINWRTLARLSSRAFFVRGIRTPKENNQLKIELVAFLSMVGRNGQRLIVGCSPVGAVFHPVTFYRQAWKLAVDVQNLQLEFSTMIYQFLGISRQHYDKTKAEQIRVLANNETQACALIARDYVLIPLGRLPDSAFNAHTLNAKEVRYA